MYDDHVTGWTAILLVCRIIVGSVFLLAAVDKVTAVGAFAESIRGYHLMPSSWSLPIAYVLPWVELLASVYVILGFLTRVGAAIVIVMLVMFIGALGHALITGDTGHACGCFGLGGTPNPVLSALEGGDTIGWWDLIRDVILVAMSGLVLWMGAGRWAVDAAIHAR